MSITIAPERPDTPDSMQLIDELEGVLSPLYPDESRHGYSVEKLLKQSVTFFVARQEEAAAGCAGVQFYGTEYAELKRMYVRPDFRGEGIAKKLLNHIADFTRENDIPILRLETGIHQTEAIGLYEKYGFKRVSPFGEYKEDPNSIFFEIALD